MRLFILLFLISFSDVLFSQNNTEKDSIVFTTVCLNKKNPNYIIEGIRIQSTDTINKRELEELLNIESYKLINKTKAKIKFGDFGLPDGVLLYISDRPIDFDGIILTKRKEKVSSLKTLIVSKYNVRLLLQTESKKKYGKIGKKGIIIIRPKKE